MRNSQAQTHRSLFFTALNFAGPLLAFSFFLAGCSITAVNEISSKHTEHDFSRVGAKTQIDFNINTPPWFGFFRGQNSFSLVTQIEGNEHWYNKCTNGGEIICELPGRYHVTIKELNSGRELFNEIIKPSITSFSTPPNSEGFISSLLARPSLPMTGRFRVTIENLEDVTVLNQPYGWLFLYLRY